MPINLIDPQSIDAYLEGFLPSNPSAATLLKHALTRALSKRAENLRVMTDLPDDAPDWLKAKWPEGGPYHRFEPDYGLDDKVRHIADWVSAAAVNQAPWLNDVDGTKPIRFKKLNTIELATAEADKDMRLANKGMVEQLKLVPPGEGETTVKELDNGFRIVQLTTITSLDREGAAMGHCIGQGGYDQRLADGSRQFFSLRDSKNQPHASLEIDTMENAVLQCQGKENRSPVARYLPYLQKFLSEGRYRLGVPANCTGLIEQNGVYHNIYDLPSNLVIKGSLNLTGTQIDRLPDGLEVGGYLNLVGTRISQLPDGLKVGGHLSLVGTQIDRLPDGLEVTGHLYLTGTQIARLPDGLEIVGSLSLTGTQIDRLPDGLKVGGSLSLRGTQIDRLPDGLKVGGTLSLGGTQIDRLPDGLKVGGNLDLGGTQIDRLPDGLEVGGSLYLTGTKIVSLPKDLAVQGEIIRPPSMAEKYVQSRTTSVNLNR